MTTETELLQGVSAVPDVVDVAVLYHCCPQCQKLTMLSLIDCPHSAIFPGIVICCAIPLEIDTLTVKSVLSSKVCTDFLRINQEFCVFMNVD